MENNHIELLIPLLAAAIVAIMVLPLLGNNWWDTLARML